MVVAMADAQPLGAAKVKVPLNGPDGYSYRPEANMARHASRRKITADEFLRIQFGSDEKFELVDGVIVSMAGGTRAHARVQARVLTLLARALRGTGCEAYGSDMAVRTNPVTIRYPDVSVDCLDAPASDEDLEIGSPRVLIEVLSASTADEDQDQKLKEYQLLPSVDTIAFLDPEKEAIKLVQRLGPDSWRTDGFSTCESLVLPTLGVTIARAEIFARD
jgi:Uma2 family endonuclease